jgi:hypothetical protein
VTAQDGPSTWAAAGLPHVSRGAAVRGLALWALLFAVYAATLALGAAETATPSGPEAGHLEAAAAAVRGDGLGRPAGGLGFPLLLAPASALGGTTPVNLLLAAVAALGFVLAAALARVVVPEPWATRAALLVGLSAPALAHASAVYPEAAAGTLLAGAALCAARVREHPRLGTALLGAGLLAALPWLAPQLVLPGAVVAAALVRWTAKRGRRVVALGVAEVLVGSLVFYVSLHDRLYGGVTPWAGAGGEEAATGAELPLGHLARIPRIAGALVDPDVGVLRWAPILALALLGAWLLARSRRTRVARVVVERREAEHVAALCLAVCGAQLVVAARAAPALDGPWFPARHLAPALPCAVPLVAWGMRHAPRAAAVLAAATAAASVWVLAGL